jgi:hypothetical protein
MVVVEAEEHGQVIQALMVVQVVEVEVEMDVIHVVVNILLKVVIPKVEVVEVVETP